MSDTRAGPQVQKLVDAIKEDIGEIVGHLTRAEETMQDLEVAAKGVNGLSAFLKAQRNAVLKMVGDLNAEGADVERKMLPSKEPITSSVNEKLAAEVRAAKEGAA